MLEKTTNIFMVGVGGQGTLLASEVLSEVLMLAGHDVKKSEVHGMSQRGGSVTSHVRYGKKVYSPLIPEGEADILFGFELLETYRFLPMLRQGGKVLVNLQKILPGPVAIGRETYPNDILQNMSSATREVKGIDGIVLALQAGDVRTVNAVLLGGLSRMMALDNDIWEEALIKLVPAPLLRENLAAFRAGQAA